MIEVARPPAGPDQDLGAQSEARESHRPVRRAFPARPLLAQRARARDRRLHHHQPLAFGLSDVRARAASRKQVGLPAAKVEAILCGLPTAFDDEREQVVYEMAIVLSNGRWVPRGLHDRAVKALGHVGITDVITLMGHYTSVAMTLAFYDVPDGATGMAR